MNNSDSHSIILIHKKEEMVHIYQLIIFLTKTRIGLRALLSQMQSIMILLVSWYWLLINNLK